MSEEQRPEYGNPWEDNDRCVVCGRVVATQADFDSNPANGEGAHLCWRAYGQSCEMRDWQNEAQALLAENKALKAELAELKKETT